MPIVLSLGFSFSQGQFNAQARSESGISRDITVFSLGAPTPECSNAVLQEKSFDRYLLDLHSAPEAVQTWLAEPRPFRIATAAVNADARERDAQSYTTNWLWHPGMWRCAWDKVQVPREVVGIGNPCAGAFSG